MQLFEELCSYENLEEAFNKAKKGKTQLRYVAEFEENLEENLFQLSNELFNQTYQPQPLKTFILKDPKTRKISKSAFRDRVVHHAICNIIEPFFERKFIYDSYANRKNKGTIKAIQRFDTFKRKASKNNTQTCFVLKADIKQYFDNVEHEILINLIKKEIKDENIIELLKKILNNHKTSKRGKGMPLGNLTSQFLANVYLHELDIFVKHKLKVKYYLRYVDDFVILSSNKTYLEENKQRIENFLNNNLLLTLHPQKSQILELSKGIPFLGFRIFYNHKLLLKKNLKKFERTFKKMKELYDDEIIDREKAVEKFEGWLNFASQGNTYKLRKEYAKKFNKTFPIIENTAKQEKFQNKINQFNQQFTIQKTLQLFKQGLNINEIAQKRNLKEGTIWSHISQLIQRGNLSIYNILKKEDINQIRNIADYEESLSKIKDRLNNRFDFNQIDCVKAHIKFLKRTIKIREFFNWYQKKHCYRKCNKNKKQREVCKIKMKFFSMKNPNLEMKKKEFIEFFNNHLDICALPKKEKIAYIPWEEFKRLGDHKTLKM